MGYDVLQCVESVKPTCESWTILVPLLHYCGAELMQLFGQSSIGDARMLERERISKGLSNKKCLAYTSTPIYGNEL